MPRSKNSGKNKILTVSENLNKFKKNLERKMLRSPSQKALTTERNPNNPVIVTHMSPSRATQRPHCRTLFDLIDSAIDLFPEGSISAILKRHNT